MKILSFNIRGAGSRIKRKEAQDIIRSQGIDFCCLQETKIEAMNDRTVRLIWGGDRVGRAAREGRSGGILTMWNSDKFSCASFWDMSGAVIVNGYWGREGMRCCLINIYAPTGFFVEKAELWDRILNVISQNEDCYLSLVGDFNSIRIPSERRGSTDAFQRRDLDLLDGFIREANLSDLLLQGRKYSWYKGDETCKSRIDRIMVNNGWLDNWPSSSVKGLQRSVSDHCPLVLDTKVCDWGPKPFRFINAWTSHPDLKNFMENAWNGYSIPSWGGFILKEKLKLLKADLKRWNKDTFGVIENIIENLKDEMQESDLKDDMFGRKKAKCIRRKEVTTELYRSMFQRNSLKSQKEKIKWLKEGDVNSSFFHRVVNFRRKQNEITSLMLNGEWIEEVKKRVHEFFKNQFRRVECNRPILTALNGDKRLSAQDNQLFTEPFSEKKILDAISDCDSSKSPGPDGFSFKFIKECWHILKGYIMKKPSLYMTSGRSLLLEACIKSWQKS